MWRPFPNAGPVNDRSLRSTINGTLFYETNRPAGGKVVSNAEVLWANYPTQATLSLALTVALEREKLPILAELKGWEWAVVAGVSVGVNWMGNLLQQVTIKHLGAPQVGGAAFCLLSVGPAACSAGVWSSSYMEMDVQRI